MTNTLKRSKQARISVVLLFFFLVSAIIPGAMVFADANQSFSVGLTVLPAAKNVEVGQELTFTADAQNAPANLEYRFFVNDFDRDEWSWATYGLPFGNVFGLNPVAESFWQAENEDTWTPDRAGRFDVVVWVREVGAGDNHNNWLGFAWASVVVKEAGADEVQVVDLTASEYVNGKVNLTAVANFDDDNYQYMFAYNSDYTTADNWVFTPWQADNTYEWTPEVVGKHLLAVWIKGNDVENGSPDNYMAFTAYDQIAYNIHTLYEEAEVLDYRAINSTTVAAYYGPGEYEVVENLVIAGRSNFPVEQAVSATFTHRGEEITQMITYSPQIVASLVNKPTWETTANPNDPIEFDVELIYFDPGIEYTVRFGANFGSVTAQEVTKELEDGKIVIEGVKWAPVAMVEAERTGTLTMDIVKAVDSDDDTAEYNDYLNTKPATQQARFVQQITAPGDATIYSFDSQAVVTQADRIMLLFEENIRENEELYDLLVRNYNLDEPTETRSVVEGTADALLEDTTKLQLTNVRCEVDDEVYYLRVDFSEAVNDFTLEEAQAEAVRQAAEGLYTGTEEDFFNRIWGSSVRNLNTWVIDGTNLSTLAVAPDIFVDAVRVTDGTLVQDRDTVRIRFNALEDIERFLGTGQKILQVNTSGDWAAVTDQKNVVPTQERQYTGCYVPGDDVIVDPPIVDPARPDLKWWMDGKDIVFGDDFDFLNESPEQFIVELSRQATNHTVDYDIEDLVIIVPDTGNYSPAGRHLTLRHENHPDSVAGLEFTTTVLDATWPRQYMIELVQDWTVVFDTETTQEAYHQPKFNPIRLELPGVSVSTASSTLTNITLRAEEDIRLREDRQSPFITHYNFLEGTFTGGQDPDQTETTNWAAVNFDVIENVQRFGTGTDARRIEVSHTYIPANQPNGLMLVLDRDNSPGAGHFPLADNAWHRVVVTTERFTETETIPGTIGEVGAITGAVYLEMNEPVQWRDAFGYNNGGADATAPLTPNQDQAASDGVPTNLFEYVQVLDDDDATGETIFGSIITRVATYGGATHASTGKTATARAIAQDLTGQFDREWQRDFAVVVEPNQPLTEGTWRLVVRSISDDVGNTMETWQSPVFEVTRPAVDPAAARIEAAVARASYRDAGTWQYPIERDPVTQEFLYGPAGIQKDIIHVLFSAPMADIGSGSPLRNLNWALDGGPLPTQGVEITFGLYGIETMENDRGAVTIFLPPGTLQEKETDIVLTGKNLVDANGNNLATFTEQLPYPGGVVLLNEPAKDPDGYEIIDILASNFNFVNSNRAFRNYDGNRTIDEDFVFENGEGPEWVETITTNYGPNNGHVYAGLAPNVFGPASIPDGKSKPAIGGNLTVLADDVVLRNIVIQGNLIIEGENVVIEGTVEVNGNVIVAEGVTSFTGIATPQSAQLQTVTPGGITLTTNVTMPNPGQTDESGELTGWAADTADKIAFEVEPGATGTTSTITINGRAYTSGAEYTITAGTEELVIVVRTTHPDELTAVRTFKVSVE